jgi:hypothetical protein
MNAPWATRRLIRFPKDCSADRIREPIADGPKYSSISGVGQQFENMKRADGGFGGIADPPGVLQHRERTHIDRFVRHPEIVAE